MENQTNTNEQTTIVEVSNEENKQVSEPITTEQTPVAEISNEESKPVSQPITTEQTQVAEISNEENKPVSKPIATVQTPSAVISNKESKPVNKPITNTQTTAVSEKRKSNVKKTAGWMIFFATLLFISAAGLIALAALALMNLNGFYYGGTLYTYDTIFPIVIAAVCIIFAFILLLPSIYLYRSAFGYRKYCRLNDNNALDKAFLMQKKFWQTIGIITVVFFVLAAIGIVAGILTGSFNLTVY